ncbi:WD40 repeat domain-containing protein [Streptomyces glaucus]|uniref:Novel STAND NTPase 1 domain-containing protein n=1 Tax=Streptomyces glaucus TaxID=284029 RepID=A0ABN3KBP8_9ACTN
MNTAASLASPGTCAVLVGTGRHAPGSALPDLPSVDATLDALQRVLVEVCGLDPGQVRRVPGDAGPQDVVGAVEAAVAEATGTVLLYYVGHGLLGPRDELYLATHGSRSAESVAGAVPYRTLRDLLGEAAGGGVVVLDCCFSGRAAAPADGRPREPYASARPDGSLLLGSASHFALSFAPEDEPYTLFSGRLLRLLEEGDPAGPPWLTWDHLYAALDREFADGPVRPRRRSDGDLGRLAVARNRAYRPDAPPAATPPADVPCPYPGMEAFRVEDSGHFFGREELTGRLLDMVCAPGDRTRAVVLVGASGVGKSSLLRAGLLAALERRHETGRDDTPWPALLLPSPDERPLHALAELWGRATGRGTDDTLGELSSGRFPAPLAGRRPCRLLVVDQFEEVFTRCRDGEELARFLTLLTGDAPGRPRVVLGLRADHYGSALAHPVLAHALEHAQLAVRPMSDDALHAAIEEPARAVGLTLEEGLADRLLHDLRQGHRSHREGQEHDAAGPGPGAALPFLAHALRETWLRRSGATLTLAGYQATGGIWHSVTTTTEALYQSLDGAGRQVLREMLLRLVQLTADGTEPVVRRRTGSDALLDGFTPSRQRTGTVVLNRLAEARLVTVDRAEVRISHEALLRAWPRLRRWIEEDRAELLRRQQLEEAADAWESAGRDPAYLYRGTRLAAVDSWAEARVRSLRALDREFLDASRTTARAERDREQRRTRRLKQALTGVAVALCLALLAGGAAFQQRGQATEQRQLAVENAIVAEARNLRGTQPRTSLRLGLAAYRGQRSADARAAVFDTLVQGRFLGSSSVAGATPTAGELSPDGELLAARDGTRERLVLWDVAAAGRSTRLGTVDGCAYQGGSRAFSGDGRILAVSCGGDTVGLWRTDSLRRAFATLPRADGTRSLALDSTGRLLAVANDRGIRLWRIAGGAEPELLHDERVSRTASVMFSPDGRLLVTTAETEWKDGRTVFHNGILMDVSRPENPGKRASVATADGPVALTPDDRTLIISLVGIVETWDVSDPAAPVQRSPEAIAHSRAITALAISHDGSTMVTGGRDNKIVLWDLSGTAPERTATLSLHEDTITSLAFAADDSTFVSTDRAGVTARWRTVAEPGPTPYDSVDDPVDIASVAYSPDSKTLITGNADGSVVLRDITGRGEPRVLRSHQAEVGAIAVSHDGRTLATGSDDGLIRLWDLRRATPRPIGRPLTSRGRVASLAFAPDAPVLWAVGVSGARTADGIIGRGPGPWTQVWDVHDAGKPEPLDTDATGPVVSFSSDGRLVLVGMSLVDGRSRKVISRLTGDALPPTSLALALHPDGDMLAAGDWGASQRVRMWEILDSGDLRSRGGTEGVENTDLTRRLAFHPGGNLLVEMTSEGVVTLYDVGDPAHPRSLGVLDRLANLVTFSPDGRQITTVNASGNAVIWDTAHLARVSADPVGTACEIAGGGLTRDEWDEYVPGQPYEASCP